jgi:hypothetical protein
MRLNLSETFMSFNCRFVRRLIVFCSFICFVGVSFVDATTIQKLSFDWLIREADVIVRGRVENLKSQQAVAGRSIATVVAVSVEKQFKGSPVSSITIEQPGGSMGDIAQGVPGSPQFSPDEDVFLFLKRKGRGTFEVIGGKQGKFTAKSEADSNNWIVEDFARRTEALDSFLDRLTSMVKLGR